MKRFKRIVQVSVMTALCLLVCANTVHAAGSVSLLADKETCSVGDDYKVTVNADNPADASVAPEISITYDPRRLSFKDCSCSYGGGGGGLITLNDTSADITFSVLSGGTAVVEASAVFDGDGADAKTSSVTLSVDGEDIASMEDATGSQDLGIEGGSIAGGDGSKLVSAVFADEFMPMGFYKTSVTYEEQLVEAAQFDMGNIVLLYVTDENGNNGNFNVYDQETGELSDFLQISGIENRFIIVLRAKDAETDAPEGFTLATLQWNEQILDAYAHDGLSDFFLLYAISSEGNKGWYMYDQKDGTYQRFVSELYGNTGAGNAGTGDINDGSNGNGDDEEGILNGLDIKLIVIIALAAILLGLLIAVIIMGIKLHEFNSYEYIDEDEYEAPYPDKSSQYSYDINKQYMANAAERQANSTPAPEGRKLTASELVAREMNTDIKNPDLMKEEKKALKAEEKARKKAEKKMKKEYGEFGPANFSQWQEAVRDDRKVSEEDLQDVYKGIKTAAEIQQVKPQETPEQGIPESDIQEPDTIEPRDTVEPAISKQKDIIEPVAPKKQNTIEPLAYKQQETIEAPKKSLRHKHKQDTEEQVDTKKDSYVKMMKKLPANDKNEPVQPKPVQQFDLDEDFEFEFLNLDDD